MKKLLIFFGNISLAAIIPMQVVACSNEPLKSVAYQSARKVTEPRIVSGSGLAKETLTTNFLNFSNQIREPAPFANSKFNLITNAIIVTSRNLLPETWSKDKQLALSNDLKIEISTISENDIRTGTYFNFMMKVSVLGETQDEDINKYGNLEVEFQSFLFNPRYVNPVSSLKSEEGLIGSYFNNVDFEILLKGLPFKELENPRPITLLFVKAWANIHPELRNKVDIKIKKDQVSNSNLTEVDLEIIPHDVESDPLGSCRFLFQTEH